MNDKPTAGISILQAICLMLLIIIFQMILGGMLHLFAKNVLAPQHKNYQESDLYAFLYMLVFIASQVIPLLIANRKMNCERLFVSYRNINWNIVIAGIFVTVGTSLLVSGLNVLLPLPEDTTTAAIGIYAVFMGTVAAPVLEELIFRAVILNGLLKKYAAVPAILISSLLFSVGHLYPWHIVATFMGGCVLGWIFYRTRSLTACILVHMAHNALSYFTLDTAPKGYTLAGTLVLGCAGIFIGVRYLKRQFNKQLPIYGAIISSDHI